MKRSELRARLERGEELCDILQLMPGQECEIFKTAEFTADDEILYIPDVILNCLVRCVYDPRTNIEYADDVIRNTFTGLDFIDECSGDLEKAKRLWRYCDWQHPSAALDEIVDEQDSED